MRILMIEPYFTGSHKQWVEGFAKYSTHQIELLTMSGHYWKWRMHGGAVTLARKFNEETLQADLLLVSDMLDLTTFKALTKTRLPVAVYFHENQLCYPWSETDEDVIKERDNHYSFINYSTALAADTVYFNSAFHYNIFFEELENFLKGFPDHNELDSIENIKTKSKVLHLGMDLKRFDQFKEEPKGLPLVLWNHRWEYDKNPEDFFSLLLKLADEGIDFNLCVLGQSFSQQPEVFDQAKNRLGDRVVQFGHAQTFEEYARWLWRSDFLPVTSNQDFFGGSVIEAIYTNCYPFVPNRLVYPEHIPEEFREMVMWQDEAELETKLRQALIDIQLIRNVNFSDLAAKYDWEHMIKTYDKELEQLIDGL